MNHGPVRLGLRDNAAQFSLLVLINAFVGLMVGLERAVLPLFGRENFHSAHVAAGSRWDSRRPPATEESHSPPGLSGLLDSRNSPPAPRPD